MPPRRKPEDPRGSIETLSSGVSTLRQSTQVKEFNLNVSIMNGKDVLLRLAH